MKPVYTDKYVRMFCGDSRKTLAKEKGVDLIFTSPPYNAGKGYDKHDDSMAPKDWWAMIADFGKLTYDICRPGAFAVWNVPMWMGSRPRSFIPMKFIQTITRKGWKFVDWIVWVKNRHVEYAEANTTAWGNFPTTPAIRTGSEPLLVFRKGTCPPRDRSDISRSEWAKLTIGVWAIHPEAHQRVNPAMFPNELCRRVIKLYSAPGELVCDPFMGTGRSLIVAKRMLRRGVGSDVSEDYVNIAADNCCSEIEFGLEV